MIVRVQFEDSVLGQRSFPIKSIVPVYSDSLVFTLPQKSV